MSAFEKPLVWLHGEVKSPPFSRQGRIEAGNLLRRLQRGDSLGLPHSRPMPAIGVRCHELRIADPAGSFRIFYRADPDAIVILGVWRKTTRQTPKSALETFRERLRRYQADRTCTGS